MNEDFDQRSFELIKALSNRLDLLSSAVDVLGHLVKLQGERIDKLEDRLKQAQSDGY